LRSGLDYLIIWYFDYLGVCGLAPNGKIFEKTRDFMTIKEILSSEGVNFDSIVVYREGLFWRCYERSAYNFVKHIKTFQPHDPTSLQQFVPFSGK
jgi:hypothetical protein